MTDQPMVQSNLRSAPIAPDPQEQVQPDPKTRKDQIQAESDNRWLRCGVIIACCLLIIALGGVAAILVFWIEPDYDPFRSDDDGAPQARSANTTTSEPTGAPVSGPTAAPTAAPTPNPDGTWTLTTESTNREGDNTDLAESLAMAGNYLVAGEARFGVGRVVKEGQVIPFTRTGPGQTYNELDVLTDSTTDNLERFGSAVDMQLDVTTQLPILVVGSSRTKGTPDTQQFNDRFGAIFYYEYDGTDFVQVGEALRGDELFEEAGGLLGDAVAVAQLNADTKRIAAAAPSSNIQNPLALDVGRIYTWERQGDDAWTRMTTDPIFGPEGSFLGTSLDLNSIGSLMIAGAPGSLPADGSADGLVKAYTFSGSSWDEFAVNDATGPTNASFGSIVRFIQQDGSQFAAAGPTASGGGMIRVFQASGNAFSQLGNDIVGTDEDTIGNALCGDNGLVATGTTSGKMIVYTLEDGEWRMLGAPVMPSANTPITACAMVGTTVAVGTGNDQLYVYDLQTSN